MDGEKMCRCGNEMFYVEADGDIVWIGCTKCHTIYRLDVIKDLPNIEDKQEA